MILNPNNFVPNSTASYATEAAPCPVVLTPGDVAIQVTNNGTEQVNVYDGPNPESDIILFSVPGGSTSLLYDVPGAIFLESNQPSTVAVALFGNGFSSQVASAQLLPNTRLAFANFLEGISNWLIDFVGDSLIFGIGSPLSSTYPTQGSLPALVAAAISRYGYAAAQGFHCCPSTEAGDPDLCYTQGAGWGPASFGAAANAALLNNSTTNALIFADPTVGAVKTFRVWYITGTTGSFTGQVSLSGSANGSLTTQSSVNGTPVAGNYAYLDVPATTANSGNSVQIIRTSGTIYIVGVEPMLAGKSIEVGNFGIGGAYTSDWLNHLTDGYGGLSLLQAHKPALVVLQLGVNDGIGSVPVATYIAHMRQIITTLQGFGIDVIVKTWPRSSSNSTAGPFEDQYYLPLLQLCASLGVLVYDSYARYGKVYPSVYMADNWHMLGIGYADDAEGFTAFLKMLGILG